MILTTKRFSALERFSDYLYARAGLSPTTIDLTLGFVRRMAPVTGWSPSHSAIDRYIATLRKAGTSYANLSNAIKAIEHYMRFLHRPIRLGRPKRPPRTVVSTLSEGKVAILINATRTIRERAMLALLAFSGIRNAELTALRIRDVDPGEQTVAVRHGKGSKSRIVYVTGSCMEILLAYMKERNGEPDDLLFLTVRRKQKLQTQDIRKMVKAIAKRAGIKRRIWPHLFRHSLATLILDRGASIYSVQAILGHSSVSTTLEYYVHPSRRSVQADYTRTVPAFV